MGRDQIECCLLKAVPGKIVRELPAPTPRIQILRVNWLFLLINQEKRPRTTLQYCAYFYSDCECVGY